MRKRHVTTHEVRHMRELALAGLGHWKIAHETGRSIHAVSIHVGDLIREVRSKRPPRISDRAMRLLVAYESTPSGMRHDLAGRFGLSSVGVLKVRACQIRRQLREAEEMRRAA